MLKFRHILKYLITPSFLFLLIVSICQQSQSANSHLLATGQTAVIDEHGICRVVENSTGMTIFIPTKTAGEWSSFYNNPPSNVTAPPCASCSLDGANVAHGASRTFYMSTRSCYGTCGAIAQGRNCYNGVLSGSASYNKANCPAPTCSGCTSSGVSWSTGSFICNASATAGSHTTTRNVSDSAAPSVGSAAFQCDDGSWSQTSGSCGGASCARPWGGTISHGQSVTAYYASSVTCGNTCSGQTRTCSNGTLTGSYAHASCSVGACASCSLDGATVAHGGSRTFYRTNRSCGQACSAIDQVRSCNNGTLSGSGSYSRRNCPAESCANCSLDGATVAHGGSRTFYRTSRSCGQACSAIDQVRSCSNGSLSGSSAYSKRNCPAAAACGCTLPWGGSINEGQSVTAYQYPSIPYGGSCIPQTRTCSGGSLTGSYTYPSCTVQPMTCAMCGAYCMANPGASASSCQAMCQPPSCVN